MFAHEGLPCDLSHAILRRKSESGGKAGASDFALDPVPGQCSGDSKMKADELIGCLTKNDGNDLVKYLRKHVSLTLLTS